ncbi:hypothetical protein FNF28_01720 [Cafeteria roenbergensis]|uniref:NAD(P)-binding domain-containing protein n=1 Tax=Cafeteria roenbergensis TaxID=33653 RepID=A0A5A8E1I4_CAFRO|nr:hypothetical protein FNF28_01720 [Cafeteria roenbergensis]
MRVFVSAADSYMGRHIVARLRRLAKEAARGGEAEPAELVVVGTLSGAADLAAPELDEEFKVGDLAAAKAALSCSAVIVNLVAAPLEAASLLQVLRDGDEALAGPKARRRGPRAERPRRLVALSSLISWEATRRPAAEDGSGLAPLSERSFRRRRAATQWAQLRSQEAHALALAAAAAGAHPAGLNCTAPSRNRGWVLCGYPRSAAEAEALVGEEAVAVSPEEEEEADAAAIEQLREGGADGDGGDVYGVEDGSAAAGGAAAGGGGDDEGGDDDDAVRVSRQLVPAVVVELDSAAPEDELAAAAVEEARWCGEADVTAEAAAARVAAWRRLNPSDGSAGSAAGFFSVHCGVEAVRARVAGRDEASADAEGKDEDVAGATAGAALLSVEELLDDVVPLLEAAGAPVSGPGSAAAVEAAGLEAAALPAWAPGPPQNFHPTPEEAAAEAEAAAAASAEAAGAAEAQARKEAAAEAGAAEARRADEAARVAALAEQEAELLRARSEPLRAWLGREVLPALSRGLLETVRAKPLDPVDFLAELLLKEALAEGEAEAGTLA